MSGSRYGSSGQGGGYGSGPQQGGGYGSRPQAHSAPSSSGQYHGQQRVVHSTQTPFNMFTPPGSYTVHHHHDEHHYPAHYDPMCCKIL